MIGVFPQIVFDSGSPNHYSVHAMNTRQNQSNSEKESQLTLELLKVIDQQDDISQRHLAQEMGVALGLANSYLKRCVKKGWIKITTAPANRYMYYLTPNGFAEKARLTAEFFSTSLALFRQSGDEYTNLFKQCEQKGFRKVVLVGLSDLTEIALMRAMHCDVEVLAIFQPGTQRSEFFNVPIIEELLEPDSFDCAVLTSMEQTTDLLQCVGELLEEHEIIVPEMLLNMKYRDTSSEEQQQSTDVSGQLSGTS